MQDGLLAKNDLQSLFQTLDHEAERGNLYPRLRFRRHLGILYGIGSLEGIVIEA
jgi:hypothetical protein